VGSGGNELLATSASSSADVWAVGDYRDDAGLANTLIEHWDGQSWSVVASPDVANVSNYLLAVDGLSSDDAWEWVTFEREEDAPAALSRLFALPAG